MAPKKRRVPGVSVYRRGNKWSYLIYGEPDILTCKRERTYAGGFEDEDAAWDAALKKKAEVGSGLHVKPSSRTVDEFFTEWLASVRHSLKNTAHANYAKNVAAYIAPIIGGRKLQDISVRVLNAFYVHLLESGRIKPDNNTKMYDYWKARQHRRDGNGPTPKEVSEVCGTSIHAARSAVIRFRRGRVPKPHSPGLAPKSVKNIHRLIHRAFKDAVAWQYLIFNPAEHANVPRTARGNKNRPKPWTVEELARWLKVAVDDRFAGMWVLAATTGMRRSELAGAQRDLLDMDRAILEIEDTRVVVDGKPEDSDGKSDSGVREISLDPFTVEALSRHVSMLDEERKAFGSAYPKHGKLMCWENGKPLHPDTITTRFNRLVDKAGVRRIRLHDIRHTYSTLSLDSGINPKIVSDRVGHANMNVTFQIYTHRSTGHDRPAAELIARLIQAAMVGKATGGTGEDEEPAS